MSLTTAARLKTMLGIPAGVTFHDSALEAAADYANGYVLGQIGQPGGLVATTRTDYPSVYTAGQIEIMLSRAPVVSIIAITNGDYAVQAGEYRLNAEDGTLRLLRGNIGSRRLLAAWSDLPDDVVVTYLHGYTAATVPADLKRAADLIAVHSYQRSPQLGRERVRNSTFGQTVDSYAIPPDAAMILANYVDVHHT